MTSSEKGRAWRGECNCQVVKRFMKLILFRNFAKKGRPWLEYYLKLCTTVESPKTYNDGDTSKWSQF